MTRTIDRTMQETMRLMQSGDLQAATRAIQRGLCSTAGSAAADPDLSNGRSIEGQFRVVADAPCLSAPAGATSARSVRRPGSTPDGEFRDHRFRCDAGSMHYKLFIPAGLAPAAPPLIVMLHGCTQSPDDFARGTRMNALAQEHGYVVAYPAQSQRSNASKCWNWFRGEDQQRGRGEPALIAALTRHLVQVHGLDACRVYAAGLSAGGAMAAVLASTYPDVYAAIGVHSGLPFGAARDLPTAFAAMTQGAGARPTGALPVRADSVPAIVFHGDRDTTVHPCNGAAVVSQRIDAALSAHEQDAEAARVTVERGSVPAGRAYTRTVFTHADGSVAAEQWVVHGGGHAWFGGDPAGSYTDASGPDASDHMLRFFSQCARPVAN